MYDATFWSNVINSLAWPITVFGILFLFRGQIIKLVNRLKQLKYLGVDLEFGDTIQVFSPADNALHPVSLRPVIKEPPPSEKPEIEKLPPEEIEASKKRAQARLDDDTKKVGYQRGNLFQLPNGHWAIAWKAEATVQIGFKSG